MGERERLAFGYDAFDDVLGADLLRWKVVKQGTTQPKALTKLLRLQGVNSIPSLQIPSINGTVSYFYTGLSVIPGIRAHTGPREFQSHPQKQLPVCFVQSGYSDIPDFLYTEL